MKFKFSPMYVVVPVLVIVGGVFAFAETSVPGNMLYPVKISISEPIIGVFAFSKEDKVEWDERLIERRLQEAAKLVSADNLSEPIRASVETNIKNQIEKFRINVANLAREKNGATTSSDLSLRLEAALNAY